MTLHVRFCRFLSIFRGVHGYGKCCERRCSRCYDFNRRVVYGQRSSRAEVRRRLARCSFVTPLRCWSLRLAVRCWHTAERGRWRCRPRPARRRTPRTAAGGSACTDTVLEKPGAATIGRGCGPEKSVPHRRTGRHGTAAGRARHSSLRPALERVRVRVTTLPVLWQGMSTV
jgi:hypothetical protein